MTFRLTEGELAQLLARRAGKPRRRPNGRRWETELAFQLDQAGFAGGYEEQYRFLADRRFRFDFAWPDLRIAVEIDGQVHAIKKRREGDVKRGQIAMMNGWKVLHVLPAQVRSGEALGLVKEVLAIAHCP